MEGSFRLSKHLQIEHLCELFFIHLSPLFLRRSSELTKPNNFLKEIKVKILGDDLGLENGELDEIICLRFEDRLFSFLELAFQLLRRQLQVNQLVKELYEVLAVAGQLLLLI